MNQNNQTGSIAALLSIVLLSVFLVGALIFGFWAFGQMQDYKNNYDKKVAVEVANAKKAQAEEDLKKYQEELKNPNKTYKGPVTYGTVTFNYPKTWSAYVDETSTSQPIDGYFYPDKVPSIDGDTAFALRVELVDKTYSQTVQEYEQLVKKGTATAVAYIPPKMKDVKNVQPGLKIDGVLSSSSKDTQKQSLVVIQVRDKTLLISSQSSDFFPDFNNTVLASLTFAP